MKNPNSKNSRQFGIFYKYDSIPTLPLETGTAGDISLSWRYRNLNPLTFKIRPMDDINGNNDEWMPGYDADTGKPLNTLFKMEY